MSNSDFGAVALLLFALVATAHLCGFLFTRLRQLRVVASAPTSRMTCAWLDNILPAGQPLRSGHEVLSIVGTRGEAVRP